MTIGDYAQSPALTELSATDLARSAARGLISAEQIMVDHLAQIARREPGVHALVSVRHARALRRARSLDLDLAQGRSMGPLAGVPVVIKDNIDLRGQVTASGSRAHRGVIARDDAEVVRRLRDAGAIIVGRANMDELAMGASTQTSAKGRTFNPHDRRRSPGGSSGGCAAAVAAHEVPLAVGTDTGGSVREPAAQCGVFGMAPTPGLVPTMGVMPFAPELDRVGPIARTVADLSLLLDILADRTHDTIATSMDLTGLRVGLLVEQAGPFNQPGVLMRLQQVIQLLVDLGATVDPVTAPSTRAALGTYMTLTSAASVPYVAPYVETGLTGPEVNRRYEQGVLLRSGVGGELRRAQVEQRRLTADLRNALDLCDVILSPTMPTTAPLLDRGPSSADLADPLTAPYTDCWTVLANLAGLPALSMPSGLSPYDDMPVGTMLMGRPGSDHRLLQIAATLEAAGINA